MIKRDNYSDLKKSLSEVVLASVLARLDPFVLTRKNQKCNSFFHMFNNTDVYVPLTEMPLTESNLLYLYHYTLPMIAKSLKTYV